jgi:isopentenyl-diphosphate Delta-isomerase
MSTVAQRKASHLQLCATADVEARGTTLLDQVHLLHDALPELAWDEVDMSCEILGRQLRAPILISGMSGGTPEAGHLNRSLAEAACQLGVGMGVGSQRAMLVDPSTSDTYRVRDVAPDILLLANIGAVQAREAGVARVAALVDAIGADALCVHFNPAQEVVQDEGDRDFRGCLDTLGELRLQLGVPLIAKETGCGFSPRTLDRLHSVGIDWVDVAGAGGTTWTGVEALRGSRRQQALGLELREWGIPTAASVHYAVSRGFLTIASGGIRGAADAVGALVLGAQAVSLALPFLRAWVSAGTAGVVQTARGIEDGIRAMMLLTGCRRVHELCSVPRVLGPELRAWINPVAPALRDNSEEVQERR